MINSFTGNYFFLSNYYEAPVEYEGIRYRNNEAAFQAQKTISQAARAKFARYPPNLAKREGRKVELRADWESIKDDIMYGICRCKFKQNPNLLEKLLATGDEELIEGNTWGDTYWGVCDSVGENHLGKTLMLIRSELQSSSNAVETNEAWIRSLSRKQLAKLLISERTEPEYDEGIDGEMYECYQSTYYITSDGQRFWEDYDGALEHECWWLAQTRVKEDTAS